MLLWSVRRLDMVLWDIGRVQDISDAKSTSSVWRDDSGMSVMERSVSRGCGQRQATS